MTFRDREDAGRQLAEQLSAYADRKDVVVLGIPRGGVTVAFEIARKLKAPLDIVLAVKLGVPQQEELAFGAVSAGDARYLNEEIVRAANISPEEIERVVQRALEKLEARAAIYRRGRPSTDVKGRIAILVDDGVATGASLFASIRALQDLKPAKLVVAVPVAPPSTYSWIEQYVDEFICLHTPGDFYAVGQFYALFPQVSDEQVITYLSRADRMRREADGEAEVDVKTTADHVPLSRRVVTIPIRRVELEGELVIPKGATGLVLFVHGSGSSRYSPRNRQVARAIEQKGLGTLLFDLLTSAEEDLDKSSAQYRFDIDLLSDRVVAATKWLVNYEHTRHLRIGYFGASTGAAAALLASTRLPQTVKAIVSRGGRPDLAMPVLTKVVAPTLLLVGSSDEAVLKLNERALEELGSDSKELIVIAGASHLFEEPGTLEQVAERAGDWFQRYLTSEDHASRALAEQASRSS